MGFIHHEVSREFIAQPDTAKGQIVFKWPDINIRRGARAIVDADQSAVFLAKGEVAGLLGPGQHQLEATEIPFLGILIDHASDGNAYRTEIYFVGTREYTGDGFTFGGQVDSVQDPQTGMIVTLRVFGNYAMKVADPAKLILKLTGTVNVEDNDLVTGWVANQLLKVIRTEVTSQIVRNGWPILGLAAYTPDLESATLLAGNVQLADYGVELTRLGNFNVNLSDSDETALKGLAKDTAYSRLAGSFGQYAQGEALLGAGEGMAKGGGAGTQSAFIGMGMGIGGQMGQPAQPGPTPPPGPGFAGGGAGYAADAPPDAPPDAPAVAAAAPSVTCASCATVSPAGTKFCAGCGTALPTAQFCSNCGTEMAAGAKFCASCGTAAPAAAASGPAPAATEPPATEPPATEPPATEPPATEPPATEPPATEPPADPPAADPAVPGSTS
jgi:membrane protease subunit (stomatin/prohibitin family)